MYVFENNVFRVVPSCDRPIVTRRHVGFACFLLDIVSWGRYCSQRSFRFGFSFFCGGRGTVASCRRWFVFSVVHGGRVPISSANFKGYEDHTTDPMLS